MKLLENKIDIDKIKVAIFDFDDTLAIHQDKNYTKHRNENNFLNYYVNAYLYPDSFFETIEPCTICPTLKNWIDFFEKKVLNYIVCLE